MTDPVRVAFLVRLPSRLHRRLKALGRRDRRSMAWEIERAVELWIEHRAAQAAGEGSR